MLALARPYFNGHPWSHGAAPVPGSSIRYYDDNAWIGKSFVDAYRMSGLASVRSAAEGVMRFEKTGWARRKGGMYWNTKRNVRVSGATAGAIGLAVELDAVSRSNQWLSFARKAYAWIHKTLGRPNKLYRQRLQDGMPVGVMSLNVEGMMIQDGRLLSKATGAHRYLDEANATQEAVRSRFTPTVMQGICPVYIGQYFYSVGATAGLNSYANWIASKTNSGIVPTLSTWGKTRGTNPQAGAAWVLMRRVLANRFR